MKGHVHAFKDLEETLNGRELNKVNFIDLINDV